MNSGSCSQISSSCDCVVKGGEDSEKGTVSRPLEGGTLVNKNMMF